MFVEKGKRLKRKKGKESSTVEVNTGIRVEDDGGDIKN